MKSYQDEILATYYFCIIFFRKHAVWLQNMKNPFFSHKVSTYNMLPAEVCNSHILVLIIIR